MSLERTVSAYARVGEAAKTYESRWTVRALRALDPDLFELFREAQLEWERAMVTGDQDEVEAHTEGMVRAWGRITAAMEEAAVEDNGYLLGFDVRTGLRVAVSHQEATQERVRELHGERVIFVTPDEVATLLAGQRDLLSIKGAFPGCEIVDLYPTEPRAA